MLTIKQIKENVRYSLIIDLLRMIQENEYDTGLENKHFAYCFQKRHELIMKDVLGNDEYRLPKDVKKDISKQMKVITDFVRPSHIHTYLERLYPYVMPYPNCKVNKYHLTSLYYSEWLKYALFEILKSGKKAKILNFKTFRKDKIVKIDIDGISISIPIEKLDFT